MQNKKILLAVILVLLAAADVLVFMAMGAASPAPWLLLVGLLLVPLLLRSKATKCDSFLVWDEDLSVGIEAMDRDHKKLLNLINNLRAAVLCNTGEAFERRNLEDLVEYTKEHLQREEELLRQHEFPNYEGHKAQHDQMISYVNTYVRRYDEQGRKILPEVADYLTLWLTDHIKVTDKQYSAYLNERGVT
ncbi:MAG TPA: bacteriohemerythrin [Sedimenticola thiotaurini]|uniref:Bacteriohemerythrin n=1 Tax=Sedimenticola thiotaurini TaxID=1543721 RepID=A0A831RLD2_9GAMM|nr:bacteriohemerythrin [Sedimenticola thiotaurini]